MTSFPKIALCCVKTVVTTGLCFYLIKISLPLPLIYEKSKTSFLNALRPYSLDHLVEIIHDPRLLSSEKNGKGFYIDRLMEYAYYYQKVAEYIPSRADAFGLAGYCHYLLGETQKAIDLYEQAIASNPKFFWFYHNVGVLYFQKGDYQRANESMLKALKADPSAAFIYIYTSQNIYVPLLARLSQQSPDFLKDQLKAGYRVSQAVWTMSELKLKKETDLIKNLSWAELDQIKVQNF